MNFSLLEQSLRTNAATIYTIANTGAMLSVGQKRSKEFAALAAEPGCD
jgi:hypothetical protein